MDILVVSITVVRIVVCSWVHSPPFPNHSSQKPTGAAGMAMTLFVLKKQQPVFWYDDQPFIRFWKVYCLFHYWANQTNWDNGVWSNTIKYCICAGHITNDVICQLQWLTMSNIKSVHFKNTYFKNLAETSMLFTITVFICFSINIRHYQTFSPPCCTGETAEVTA